MHGGTHGHRPDHGRHLRNAHRRGGVSQPRPCDESLDLRIAVPIGQCRDVAVGLALCQPESERHEEALRRVAGPAAR